MTNDLTFEGDAAPFDRVEHLARHLCEQAGGEWDRKGTRKAHWRQLAAAQLAEPSGLGDMPTWMGVVAASGWIVLGLWELARVVLS